MFSCSISKTAATRPSAVRSFARSLGVLLCGFALSAGTVLAQATGPESARPAGPSATLAQKYEVAFRLDEELQTMAAGREQGDPYRDTLRTLLSQHFNIAEEQFAHFHAAAKSFVRQERLLEYRVHALSLADRANHPSSRAISTVLRPTLHGMLDGVDQDAAAEVATLHAKISSALAAQLDAAVEDLYAGRRVIQFRAQRSANQGSTNQGFMNAAPVAGSQPRPAPAVPQADALQSSPKPAYCPPPPPSCTTPYSGEFVMLFSADGKMVTGQLTVTIAQTDADNGCYPVANLIFDQDGNPFPTQRVDGMGSLTAVSTLAEPMNVGSTYSLDSSVIALSCMNDNDDSACGQLFLLTKPFTTGVPSVTNAPFSGNIGQTGTISIFGNDLGGPPGNTPTLNVSSGTGLTLTVSSPTNYSAGGGFDLSASQQDAGYSISSTATAATTSFTITSAWGTSSPVEFDIQCGQPTILNITPGTWVAGVATQVQVVGTNFCPGLTASVTLQDGTTFGIPGVSSGGSANASFTVTPGSSIPAQPGVLTLANSNGLSGNYPISITNTSATGTLYFLDPFLLPKVGVGSTTIDQNEIITDIQTGIGPDIQALGIVADGYSNFIAVYESESNGDVTFSSSENLSLVQTFDVNFLTDSQPGKVAPSGATTVVPSAQLTASNGKYYAFALVRTPFPKVRADISDSSQVRHITVSQAAGSNTGPTSGSNSIMLYQKPILLVHGLWAGLTSLSDIQNALGALPNQTPNGIVPICYSRFIPYDAVSDPYVGTASDPYNGSPLGTCEDTSANQISAALANINAGLDLQHIVEGQIDYVAHSMGGLAGRNYSNLQSSSGSGISYRNYTNLNQGAFSQAITIDTPELGSGLANFLVANANSSLNANTYKQFPGAAALYNAVCLLKGSTTSTNLSQCFGDIGMPLNWPGPSAGPTSGAVASLQINGASGSSIGNTGDFVVPTFHTIVASVYPDNQSPSSLLRDVLQNFATAVSDNATTLSTYLGSTSYGDDVIVTLESQVWPLTPATFNQGTSQGVPFSPVAHTAAAPGVSAVAIGILNDSDNNILQWDPLYPELICKLISSGTQPCGPGYQTQTVPAGGTVYSTRAAGVQQESPSEIKNSAPVFHGYDPGKPHSIPQLDNSRVTLVQPTVKFRLAEPAEVTLRINTQGINSVLTEQCLPMAATGECTGPLENSKQSVPILSRPDGSRYIRILPITLGRSDLIVRSSYSGGVYTEESVHMDVQPSSLPVQQLLLTASGSGGKQASVILLDLDQDKRRTVVQTLPLVRYKTLLEPVHIGTKNVVYTVRGTPGDPVISIDSGTGFIKPLRAGHALLITTYAGVSTRSCVIVREHLLDSPKKTDCHELLKDDETLSR